MSRCNYICEQVEAHGNSCFPAPKPLTHDSPATVWSTRFHVDWRKQSRPHEKPGGLRGRGRTNHQVRVADLIKIVLLEKVNCCDHFSLHTALNTDVCLDREKQQSTLPLVVGSSIAHKPTSPPSECQQNLKGKSLCRTHSCFTADQVVKLISNEAPGPDGVNPRALKWGELFPVSSSTVTTQFPLWGQKEL